MIFKLFHIWIFIIYQKTPLDKRLRENMVVPGIYWFSWSLKLFKVRSALPAGCFQDAGLLQLSCLYPRPGLYRPHIELTSNYHGL